MQKGKHTFGGASGKQIMQIRETTMTKYLAIAFLITGFLVGDAYADWLSDAKSLFKKKEPALFLKCTGSLVSAGIYKLDPNTKKLSWVEDFNKMQINLTSPRMILMAVKYSNHHFPRLRAQSQNFPPSPAKTR